MSFRFSSAGSSFTVSSDFSSEPSKSSQNKSLSEIGTLIMNNSYPLINKKTEVRKDNETFAYLEKLKQLDLGEYKVEHIHHMRYLDQLDYSFKKSGKNLNAFAKDSVVDVGYKRERDDVVKEKVVRSVPEGVSRARVKVAVNSFEYCGVVLPFGIVITAGMNDKNLLKKARVVNYENKILRINKFGPLITTPDFSLFSLSDQNSSYINPYMPFKLAKLDEIQIPSQRPLDILINPLLNIEDPYQIVDVNDKYFAFSSRTMTDFQQCAPVFSNYWELQGFYSHSLLNLHFVLRLEPIFAHLLRIQPEIISEEFDNFLSFYTRFSSIPQKQVFNMI